MKLPAQIAVGVACSAAVVGLTVWGLTIMSDPAPTPTPSSSPSAESLNEPFGGVPQCTDAIADAGGICHGEPVPDVGIPTPAPLDRGGYAVGLDISTNVAPPVVVPPVVVPPVSVNERPDWAMGLDPCPVEDADNCYWDAATMGDGNGFSFVTVDGVTTYPQILPDVTTLRLCDVEDDDACYFPGRERGELANWVNAPGLAWTYFFDGVTEDLNGWVTAPAVAPAVAWHDGYVPCETPTGSTMVVGCYWDHDGETYIVTDDGEKFLIDPATGERTYDGVPE